MTAISFKSIGEKTEDVRQRAARRRAEFNVPIGVVTPVRVGDAGDGIFKMHRDVDEQIHDNLKNLILTNWGDRVIRYDFGANLQPLVFELTSGGDVDFDTTAMIRIRNAVAKFMPFITLEEFETSIETPTELSSVGFINMRVNYSVEQRNIKNKSLIVRFFVGG